jgi:PAS domain S-box-containing protein
VVSRAIVPLRFSARALFAVQSREAGERASGSVLRCAGFAALVAVAYYAGTRLGFVLTPPGYAISVFWPPNAILLSALLLAPERLWWALLLAVLPAHLLAHLPNGVLVATALGWFVSNTAEALIGAVCISRFARRKSLFETVQGLLVFLIFGVLLAPLLTSLMDAAVVVTTRSGEGYWRLVATRLFSNMLAQLTLVPMIVIFVQGGRHRLWQAGWKRQLEACSLAAGIVLVGVLIFGAEHVSPGNIPALVYVPLPLLLWASLRFGLGGTSASLLVIALISTWNGMHGRGPFDSPSMMENVLSLKVLLCMVAVPLMLLAAVIADRRRTEERLRLAQQASGIGSFERNVRTGVVTWTSEMESMYGLPPGGFGQTQTGFENLIHPDDRARVMELVDCALKTGQQARGEWRVRWPDGSIHWIAGSWQVFMDKSGEPLRVAGASMDVTRLKRTEEALLEVNRTLEVQGALLQSREELLKIFVKNVPPGVAMLDRDMRYLQVSDRWCADFSQDSSKVPGRSHYEMFPDIPDRWKQIHRRALAGETLRAEEDRWDREGGATWLRWEIRPWQNLDGVPGGILIFSEDITHRKHAEEALVGMSRNLIEAHEQERTRVGRELHDDIVQRLALLSIELERVQQAVPDASSELGTRIGALRDQTTEIVNDVQLLSHELHSSKLEYLGIVGATKNFCKEFSEHQKVKIDFQSHDLPAGLPRELSLSLFRVLQEALRNAAKHSGVKRFEVRLWGSTAEIHLTVSDLGGGFDAEAAMKGTGLGLTSMQERLRLVGGELSINSQPKGGTTIHARVPFNSISDSARAAG